MKSSIADIWVLGLVITFIMIFSAYITVTMNYSKTFKYKNEILLIIEKKNGINYINGVDTVTSIINSSNRVKSPKSALGVINVYLRGSGYSTMGKCYPSTAKEKWYGVYELTTGASGTSPDGTLKVKEVTGSNAGERYYYCFSKKGRDASKAASNIVDPNCIDNKKIPYYYDVLLFYKLDFPIIGDLFTFNVDGTTADIYNVVTSSNYDACTYV